ncbi:unnamed protein product [Mytilus edulis]|uniref:Uncharacterized protein n=1 Tax=Mytilus edulis TaxID=6550 RepID=A0A8S3UAF6_MYTED|nr:unnamed protein product [Mytilus edulis]
MSEEKGCYKSSCTSYHWTTYMITNINPHVPRINMRITRVKKKDVINPHVPRIIDNIQDNTREEKGCYKSSCTSITLVKKKDVINPHVPIIGQHITLTIPRIIGQLYRITREEKDVINLMYLVSLDNIQDNMCEEKGCYKSSCTSYHWTTYRITLVKKRMFYKSSPCTSYHWTTYRITLVKKKDVIILMYLVSLNNIQDNTREEKGCYKSSCTCIIDNIQDNMRKKKRMLINPHVPRITDNIQDNTQKKKDAVNLMYLVYHWTTYR